MPIKLQEVQLFKILILKGKIGCGGRIWTCGLQVMRLEELISGKTSQQIIVDKSNSYYKYRFAITCGFS